MHGIKIVHVLIDKFHDSDFGEVPVRFVSDEPHSKNVTQCNRNQIGTFLNQQFQAIRKVLEGTFGIGSRHGLSFSVFATSER